MSWPLKTVERTLCSLRLRFNTTNGIISVSLASLPVHNAKTPISLSSCSLTHFPCILSHTPTYTAASAGIQLVCSFFSFHMGISTPNAYIDTRKHAPCDVMDTHMHTKQSKRLKERERDPKHQNSTNPLRRSLKGFLKADFHQAEAFQVNTVCGGNGAEAFKLYALTFPLCYFLFLHLSHTASASLYHSVFCSLCILHFLSLPFWDWIRTKPAKPGNAGYV